MKRAFLLMPALCVLAACGGSDTTRVVDILTTDVPLGADVVTVTANADGTELVVSAEEGPLTVPVDETFAVGTFSVGVVENPSAYAIGLLSEGEASIATAGVYGFDVVGDDLEGSGAMYARTQDSTMPLEGDATYTGDYVALFTTEDGETEDGNGFTGVLGLNVDFEAMTVSGDITDRAFKFLPSENEIPADVSIADLQLLEFTITEAGTFSATTTGGEITENAIGGETSVVSANSYSGLFAGEEASEVVGGVLLTHTIGGTVYREVGVFASGH